MRFEPNEALKLAREASQIVVAKGKKVVTFDMKRDPPDEETVVTHHRTERQVAGPVIRRDSTMLIGFAEEEFARVLGGK